MFEEKKFCEVWKSKCLGLKIGDELEYISERTMRRGDWKKDFWMKKGEKGTIIKLNEGSPPRLDIVTEDFPEGLPSTDAWATFQFDGDEKARIAVGFDWRKEWKKIKNVGD